MNREVSRAEIEQARELAEHLLPGVVGDHLRSAVCMYTNTVDGHFVVDHHPQYQNVILASPCSGHGFKFMIALGEVVADLVDGARPRFDISTFRLDRLTDPDETQFRVRTGATRFEGEIRD